MADERSDVIYAWVARRLGVRGIHRREDVTDRAVVLALFGRFVDELASGIPLVLMPTLRTRLGLTVAQVGWCLQALYAVAAVVEPVAAAGIDVLRRRALLVWGALGWAVALLLVAGAPSYGWLVLAFVVAGAASGPLAQTTDVLLVEMHPDAEERIGARQTLLDTIGALLAPAAIAVVAWVGGDARIALVGAGLAILLYAVLLATTPVPGPAGVGAGGGAVSIEPVQRSLRQVRENLGVVLRDHEARIWLLALLGDAVAEVPTLFEPVWLGGEVGASQSMVAVHAAVELAASVVGLALLDRWVQRHDARRILTVACAANVLIYPVWLLVPGVTAKVVLAVPLALTVAPVWPLVRARALKAVPNRGGMVLAITSLYGVLPLAAAFGWVGARVGLTPTMLVVHVTATLGILLAVRRRVPDHRTDVGHGRGRHEPEG
ncbi:MAG TPA: MFS transporter [Euzebyales bacterium]|nr:MFS transporter [Euzebyales bacterium]